MGGANVAPKQRMSGAFSLQDVCVARRRKILHFQYNYAVERGAVKIKSRKYSILFYFLQYPVFCL